MIYAAFYRPEGVFNSYFNKLAAFATGRGPFCHSEFVFQWDRDQLHQVLQRVKGFGQLRAQTHRETTSVALYIIWGGEVRYRVLDQDFGFYSVPTKDKIHLNISFDKELNMLNWLTNQMGAEYDTTGAVLCMLPWRKYSTSYEKYFCSQLMACALQRLGYLQYCNPGNLSPNKLYQRLQTR